MNLETHINWAQCDSCSKWRRLSASFSIDQLPNNWVCSMNPILEYASCEVPEESYNESEKTVSESEIANTSQDLLLDSNTPTSSPAITESTQTFQNGTSNPSESSNLLEDISKETFVPQVTVVLDPKKHPIIRITDLEIPPYDPSKIVRKDFNTVLIEADTIELPDISFIATNISDPNDVYPYQSMKLSPGQRRYGISKANKKVKYHINEYNKTSQYSPNKNYDLNADLDDSADFKNIKYYEENNVLHAEQFVKPEEPYALQTPLNTRRRRSKPGPIRKIRRDVVPPPLVNWVQCEECKKWRQLPSHVKVEHLPEQWYCKMNVWDLPKADCSVPEESEPIPVNPEFPALEPIPIHRGRVAGRPRSKKGRRVEYVIHNSYNNAYSDTHYIDCPTNETVGGHPVGDRLVIYSHAHSDMTVCRTPEGVEVFSKCPIDPLLDKKRTITEPLVLSFGCKTDWELETADTIVTERQVESELEKVRIESEKLAANGIEAGRSRLLQLCPNLQGQLEKRTVLPASWPNESLLTAVKPMKEVPESIHRFVDADETVDKLKAWMSNNNTLVFSPDSQYANMLMYSAVEHPNA